MSAAMLTPDEFLLAILVLSGKHSFTTDAGEFHRALFGCRRQLPSLAVFSFDSAQRNPPFSPELSGALTLLEQARFIERSGDGYSYLIPRDRRSYVQKHILIQVNERERSDLEDVAVLIGDLCDGRLRRIVG